ncbi:7-carboxy-7-deazaguanine synthase QueE [Bacillus cereus]|uniref:7-carboxy-7-deazaguanine synthase QueE n=1 Tax=Bacillus cereus TaxID=1396 RepID=UPI0024052F50|nr:7-carboxy-7-deazaguanine synthase QueE [Bacillus cereus]MDF9530200.1 7-carboxy-7-deazaguanine synthase QueE [Bacillus cereus]MDG1578393.1 7-carboxy-7-deazaguanine synthase QueE [Bacillus cereus]
MEREKRIPVLEIFGPTIQGEGMVSGQKTIFIRTYGCDYRCLWCDSKFTWDASQKPKLLTLDEIIQKVNLLSQGGVSHVTISGGNPALLSSLDDLIDHLHEEGYKVGLETQGSIWQDWFKKIDDLTLSPKPPSSGMNQDINAFTQIVENLSASNVNYSIKVVVFNNDDFNFAKHIHKVFPGHKHQWYLQVGNTEVDKNKDISLQLLKKYEWLCQKVISDKDMHFVRPLPQLHTLIWGNKQGV